ELGVRGADVLRRVVPFRNHLLAGIGFVRRWRSPLESDGLELGVRGADVLRRVVPFRNHLLAGIGFGEALALEV
uniref:hypothetical protein n=1 Tax=Ilumatobacter sp. TaxID=1967498 RepID=UPI00262EB7B9